MIGRCSPNCKIQLLTVTKKSMHLLLNTADTPPPPSDTLHVGTHNVHLQCEGGNTQHMPTKLKFAHSFPYLLSFFFF